MLVLGVLERAPQPFHELRARRHIVFGLAPLPGTLRGLYVPSPTRPLILVHSGLNKSWRRAVLAHELVHDEDGGGCVLEGMPETWRAIAQREEQRVWDEVARWLLPLPAIVEMDTWARTNELPLEQWHVAEAFDVPEFLAVRRLELPDVSGRKVA